MFPLTLEQTRERIAAYQTAVEEGAFSKADFWHFCGFLGVDDETVLQLIRKPRGKEREIGAELKRMVCWIKGQYATAPGWSGQNSAKALFLLKQDIGGMLLTDKPERTAEGGKEIRVRFGGKVVDPFG